MFFNGDTKDYYIIIILTTRVYIISANVLALGRFCKDNIPVLISYHESYAWDDTLKIFKRIDHVRIAFKKVFHQNRSW